MTIADRSIPNVKVLMILPRKEFSKEKPLKEGYSYTPYTDSMHDDWCMLQSKTGVFETYDEAEKNLDEMLRRNREIFEKQFVFVVDSENKLVGSCGLWYGNHFGMERIRLHDVAVSPNHQHQGIATAMISKCARMYDEIRSKYPLYVATQAPSYGAIALYSRLGFTPYLGEYTKHTKEKSEKDWKFVTEVLKEKAGKR